MFDKNTALSRLAIPFWERVAAWYHESVIYELLEYFNSRYFTVRFESYENFAIGTSTAQTVRDVILALALGVILAALFTAYLRNTLGGFVRRLLSDGCDSPASAKTLSELGYFRSPSVRRELAKGTILRMVVHRVDEISTDGEQNTAQNTASEPSAETVSEGETDAEKEVLEVQKSENNAESTAKKGFFGFGKRAEEVDFITARFYVPEDLRYRAEIRFRRKGSSWLLVIAICVISLVAAALLCVYLPGIVGLADKIVSMTSPS